MISKKLLNALGKELKNKDVVMENVSIGDEKFRSLFNDFVEKLKFVSEDEELASLGFVCVGHLPDIPIRELANYDYVRLYLWENTEEIDGRKVVYNVITYDVGNCYCSVVDYDMFYLDEGGYVSIPDSNNGDYLKINKPLSSSLLEVIEVVESIKTYTELLNYGFAYSKDDGENKWSTWFRAGKIKSGFYFVTVEVTEDKDNNDNISVELVGLEYRR